VLAPLMGRDSSAQANWMDGRPARILAYPIPKDPEKGPWTPVVLSDTMHVVHNFWPVSQGKGQPDSIWAASYEVANLIQRHSRKWETMQMGAGNQANTKSNRGSSEIKVGKLKNGKQYIATIEPWHGNQVVVYTEEKGEDRLLKRFVLDEELRWGHGVWCAD